MEPYGLSRGGSLGGGARGGPEGAEAHAKVRGPVIPTQTAARRPGSRSSEDPLVI